MVLVVDAGAVGLLIEAPLIREVPEREASVDLEDVDRRETVARDQLGDVAREAIARARFGGRATLGFGGGQEAEAPIALKRIPQLDRRARAGIPRDR
ncbi:MAG TPA: hypothetical protein VFT98_14210, partial [Myxococcota bacterium]|nr:hypothetical protein [Myxococcota bacterium]